MLIVNCFLNVPYVKNSTALALRTNLLKIKVKTSLTKTIKLIRFKKPDYLIIEKPQVSQMAAVLLWRLAGKKFIWTVNFQNPPQPSFFSKLLIAQADKVITTSKRDLNKLISWGVAKSKIRYQRI